jgi:hypothetical protein
MAKYSAYFDESGHPDDSDWVIVAGAIAHDTQWIHLEREWKEVLAPLGTSTFHTVDFGKRRPPFDLSDNKANELLSRLVGIIVRRVEITIATAVRMDQYRAMNERYLLREYFGFPYPQAARSCLAYVETWAEKYSVPYRDIKCFFEDGAKDKGHLLWMADRDNFDIPDFEKKTEIVSLQVGDFLAWLHNRMLRHVPDDAIRYTSAAARLEDKANSWFGADFSDPDATAALHGIPARDPGKQYACQIVKKDGRRRALIQVWPVGQKRPTRIKKRTMIIPPNDARTAGEILK